MIHSSSARGLNDSHEKIEFFFTVQTLIQRISFQDTEQNIPVSGDRVKRKTDESNASSPKKVILNSR